MPKKGVDNLRREGLETARFQMGVGSNPTPRTKDEPTTQHIFQLLWQMRNTTQE